MDARQKIAGMTEKDQAKAGATSLAKSSRVSG
jgi:hypothetical protein